MKLKNITKCFIGFLSFVIFIGCASTKPNTPYTGPYSSGFNEFALRNPLLAKELGKLPEIQDGISENDSEILKEIVKLYSTNPKDFDKAFEQMYQVGLPNVRKYCSPLQALYWLVEDGYPVAAEDTIKDYSFEKLLDYAWEFGAISHEVKNVRAEKLINSCTDKEILKVIDDYRENDFDDSTSDYVIELSRKHSNAFEYKLAVQSSDNKQKNEARWRNFEIVVNRLNSPELVSYYTARNFIHDDNRLYIPQSSEETFYLNGGVCRHWAAFGTHSLVKAGYHVKNLTVWWGSGWNSGHTISVLKDRNGFYWNVIDDRTPGLIKGPYKSNHDIAKAISNGPIADYVIENNSQLINRNRRAF